MRQLHFPPPAAIRLPMKTVLSISSHVMHGHVGNSASTFPLQRLGLKVLAVPTIILTSHVGYPVRHGIDVLPQTLDDMLAALDANGWLNGLDAVVTGYLPTDAHTEVAAKWAERLKSRQPETIILCDPVIGDQPTGLYVQESSAVAIRDRLLPLADAATPNSFELGWLTGDPLDELSAAINAAHVLAPPTVLVTSSPAGDGQLANVLVSEAGAWRTEVHRREVELHGTGDFLAALFLAHLLRGRTQPEALALATAGMEAALSESDGDTLALVATQDQWANPHPWPIAELGETAP